MRVLFGVLILSIAVITSFGFSTAGVRTSFVPQTVDTIPQDSLHLPSDSVKSNPLAAGLIIYEGKCAKCHAPKKVDNWTSEEWKPILRSMNRKARLDSTEAANVTAYVMAHAKVEILKF